MLIVGRRFAVVLILVFATFSQEVSAQAVTITTFAGRPSGSQDGIGSDALFFHPAAVAIDGSGNLYIADARNHTIRKMTSTGVVTTLAGLAGARGSTDGKGSLARFYLPGALATDSLGNVYVADTFNYTIRKISPDGVVTTLAGSPGRTGSSDGVGPDARFYNPSGIAADSTGTLYVADSANETIRKITPAGVVTTLAGRVDTRGSADGLGTAASFSNPTAVATDHNGNVYVADTVNRTIRKITPAGAVTTLAGLAGAEGTANGTGSSARFSDPHGIATDRNGNVYVSEFFHTIRKISPEGVVTTLAGSRASGNADGQGSLARFSVPLGLTTDNGGNVYVADVFNSTIRRISPSGFVTTLAVRGNSGSDDATGSDARFLFPAGVSTDSSGNVYVADSGNSTIRKISREGGVSTVAGSARMFGSNDGFGSAARFTFPQGLAVDDSGTIYVSDSFNQTIRKITAAGVVTTFAGAAGIPGSADGAGTTARFRSPAGLAIDINGNVYVADRSNDTIRKITPGGVVTTLAGLAFTSGGSDGMGTAARFNGPSAVATDRSGNVYVADRNNHVIRKITPTGEVTTVAGSGQVGSADGIGKSASFAAPMGVAVDSSGNVFVADYGNQTIRKITADGLVTTVAGLLGVNGGSDGTGSAARFFSPQGIAVDSAGTIYIADSENNAIRKGTAALADVARIDQASGKVGSTSVLDTAPQTATSWEWSIIRRPSGSTAPLSSTDVRNPTFTADVADLYQFRVVARGPAGSSITVVSLHAEEVRSEPARRRAARH